MKPLISKNAGAKLSAYGSIVLTFRYSVLANKSAENEVFHENNIEQMRNYLPRGPQDYPVVTGTACSAITYSS